MVISILPIYQNGIPWTKNASRKLSGCFVLQKMIYLICKRKGISARSGRHSKKRKGNSAGFNCGGKSGQDKFLDGVEEIVHDEIGSGDAPAGISGVYSPCDMEFIRTGNWLSWALKFRTPFQESTYLGALLQKLPFPARLTEPSSRDPDRVEPGKSFA